MANNGIYLICILVFTFSSQSCSSHHKTIQKKSDHSCYEDCLLADRYKYSKVYFPIYTKKNPNDVFVRQVSIPVALEYSAWVKKMDKNCHSLNPNDCMVWRSEKMPPLVKSFYIVTDTIKCKDFKKTIVKVNPVLVESRGYLKKLEVLCPEDLNSKMISNIQQKLTDLGYYNNEINGLITDELMNSLSIFQHENQLPIGHFDIETIKSLQIKYQLSH